MVKYRKLAWRQGLLLILGLCLAGCPKRAPLPKSHLNTFVDADISSLDPIQSTNRYNSLAVATIFEGLYHYNYRKRPYSLDPLLAEGLPEVSENGLVYRIRIKKGVRFHHHPLFPNGEGRELTAKDVIYSWKRLADPRNRALGWWVLDGWIVGLNEWRKEIVQNANNFAKPVSGLHAPESHLVEVRLTRPSSLFLHRLALPVTAVVAQEIVEAFPTDTAKRAIGTGAYQLVEWKRGTSLDFIRNPDYHLSVPAHFFQAPSMGPGTVPNELIRLPLTDRLTIHMYREHQPLWLSFLNGEVDHAVVPRDLVDQVFTGTQLRPEYEKLGLRIHEQKKPDVVYIALNMEHPLLGKNRKLRQALAHATDRKTIIKSFYSDRGTPAFGPIPPEIEGYEDKLSDPYPFDLEKAKKLLAEAGFPEGRGLPVFDYQAPNVSSFARQFAEFIKDQWGQIGVRIQIVNNTWPQFDEKIKKKQASLFDMAWNADYPDAENFLQLFYSEHISPGPNNFNFSNTQYDDLYRRSLQASHRERIQLSHQMRDLIIHDVPAIFLLHRTFRLPYHSWLENFQESPLIYDHYKYLKINQSKKREFLDKVR